MPNLVGFWSPSADSESIRNTLNRQLTRVRVPGIEYQDWSVVSPGFGMALMDSGILENGRQPAFAEDGRFCLLLDGEIYNADALRVQFQKDLAPSPTTAPELCLRLLRKFGESAVRLLNGLFCICVFDRENSALSLFSDRLGFRPLYYGTRSGCFIFGSEIKAICAVDPLPRQVDLVGTLELFSYGVHLMDRTWIDGYLRLPPATILTLDHSGVRSAKYWSYKYQESAPRLDQATYVTVYGSLLDRAVERCMQGNHRKGIFLSGGYDSRAVAAAIQPYHKPIPAFTFGQAQSRDVRFAKLLADRLGLEHIALTETGPYLYPNCRSIVWRTEGMLPFANTTSIRFHAPMKQKMDVVLTGFLGEFGGSHTWPQLLLARSRKQAIEAIFARFLAGRLASVRRIFQSAFLEQALPELRARFNASFDVVENEHPFDIADCWNVINLQPRSTYHAPSIDRHIMEMRAPMMDAELIDFLLTIPPYSRLEQRVYKKMIAHRFPEIHDIPCTNSGRPINPHFFSEYAVMAARYGGRKLVEPLRRIFSTKEPLGREFRDLNEDFRAEPALLEQVLRPLLDAGIFDERIFNRSAIESLLEDQFYEHGRHENLVSLLVSWGLASKYFLHDDFRDVPASMVAEQVAS